MTVQYKFYFIDIDENSDFADLILKNTYLSSYACIDLRYARANVTHSATQFRVAHHDRPFIAACARQGYTQHWFSNSMQIYGY